MRNSRALPLSAWSARADGKLLFSKPALTDPAAAVAAGRIATLAFIPTLSLTYLHRS